MLAASPGAGAGAEGPEGVADLPASGAGAAVICGAPVVTAVGLAAGAALGASACFAIFSRRLLSSSQRAALLAREASAAGDALRETRGELAAVAERLRRAELGGARAEAAAAHADDLIISLRANDEKMKLQFM